MGNIIGGIIGIIIVVGLIILAFMAPFLMEGWKKRLKKRWIPVKHRITPESQQVIQSMDSGAYEALIQHMNHFNRKMSMSKEWMTSSFLKEAYFPETHTFDPSVTVEMMLRHFDKSYPRRAGIRYFALDSSEPLKNGSIAVGITRVYEDKTTSRVRYILTKKDSRWYLDHISRQFHGIIEEITRTSRNTTMYELLLEEGGSLMYESQAPVPGITAGDRVLADGYLMTEETLEGLVYYKLLQMDKLMAA